MMGASAMKSLFRCIMIIICIFNYVPSIFSFSASYVNILLLSTPNMLSILCNTGYRSCNYLQSSADWYVYPTSLYKTSWPYSCHDHKYAFHDMPNLHCWLLWGSRNSFKEMLTPGSKVHIVRQHTYMVKPDDAVEIDTLNLPEGLFNLSPLPVFYIIKFKKIKL